MEHLIHQLRVSRWNGPAAFVTRCFKGGVVINFFLALLSGLRVFFRSRANTALEVIALRQQVAVLKRKRPRPPLNSSDRLFWITLCRLWCGWKNVLLIVKPEQSLP